MRVRVLNLALQAARWLVKRLEAALNSQDTLGQVQDASSAVAPDAQFLEGGLLGMSMLLVDDDPVLIEKMRSLLAVRGVNIAGVANNGQQALQMALSLNPQVILMDVDMPELNGIGAARSIKQARPRIKIVMLTGMEQDEYLFEALRSGASGYLLKGAPVKTIFAQLEALVRGEVPLSAGLAERILAELSPQNTEVKNVPNLADGLTNRQWDILERVARGQTYKEIGADLSLTEKTIKYHMGQIIDRLHVSNRLQAIQFLKSNRRGE